MIVVLAHEVVSMADVANQVLAVFFKHETELA